MATMEKKMYFCIVFFNYYEKDTFYTRFVST